MAADDKYKIVKAHEFLIRLLLFFEDYVQVLRPKKHRGDPIMPQLLVELAEILKLTTREPDWKWVEVKSRPKPGKSPVGSKRDVGRSEQHQTLRGNDFQYDPDT